MGGESMAKKISCRVVKTSLFHNAPDAAIFKAWEDYCNSKETPPLIGFNPFNQIKEMASKPTSSQRYAGQAVERRGRSRSFDFYA
jgi:hypothetical protein